jgi:hypothetical protein
VECSRKNTKAEEDDSENEYQGRRGQKIRLPVRWTGPRRLKTPRDHTMKTRTNIKAGALNSYMTVKGETQGDIKGSVTQSG